MIQILLKFYLLCNSDRETDRQTDRQRLTVPVSEEVESWCECYQPVSRSCPRRLYTHAWCCQTSTVTYNITRHIVHIDHEAVNTYLQVYTLHDDLTNCDEEQQELYKLQDTNTCHHRSSDTLETLIMILHIVQGHLEDITHCWRSQTGQYGSAENAAKEKRRNM